MSPSCVGARALTCVICLCVAGCGHERRRFEGPAGFAGAPAASATGEAGRCTAAGAAGVEAAGSGPAARTATVAGPSARSGSSGAGGEPARASAGAGGSPPAEHAQGGGRMGSGGHAAGSAGMAGVGGAPRIPPDDGGRSGAPSVTPAAGGDGGTLGSSGSAGLAPSEAGAASGPRAELCVTDRDDVADVTMTAPAVEGTAARVRWALPVASEDYVVERYIAFDCDPALAIDDGATLSISWGLTPQYGCTVQLAVHGRTWAALPEQWETGCIDVPVEVSP
jgi:hypothetical protein